MANVTINTYGVLRRHQAENEIDIAAEKLLSLGYATIDGGYTAAQIEDFARMFEQARSRAADDAGGIEALRQLDEHNTVRALMSYAPGLLEIALNERVRSLAKRLVAEYHVLTQQNGVINPANSKSYNQAAWHRDLPYQHNVFSKPIAINALFCLDEFTSENGATMVLPASHRQEEFPSERFINANAVQVTAPAGHFIILDCMCYHTGAVNRTQTERRAINHVYGIPLLRQQIDLPSVLGEEFTSDPDVRQFLGYGVRTPLSVAEYLGNRRK